MRRIIIVWEFIGIIVIICFGFILHFAFGWTGNWVPLALFAAVNESVWEHLKIAFWPALLYGILEYPFIIGVSNNFFIAKSLSICIIPVTIAILHYSYTAVTGQHLVWADILIFVFAVIFGQLISIRILLSKPFSKGLKGLSIAILAVFILMFSVFTYFPPRLGIFMDPQTGKFGITFWEKVN